MTDVYTDPIQSETEDKTDGEKSQDTGEEKEKKDEKEKGLPEFDKVIEGFEKSEGLFTFYLKEDEDKTLMAILPDQLGEIMLCSLTRQAGDGFYFDSGSLMRDFPFFFRRVGKNIQFVHKNVKFRASEDAPIRKAIARGVSDSLVASAKIESKPHPETGAILVDAKGLFVQDIDLVADSLNERMKTDYSYDVDNSYIESIKPYQRNVEIEVVNHYKTKKPRNAYTMADSRSFFHRYRYSISRIPESDYVPRLADDRVGHFVTIHQDYTDLTRETPYVRYIERWNLQKSDPDAELSPPKKPIVFWIENTVPVEYREAVRDGILLWNTAFERVGFRDAIVVKQQPDDADWEAGDIRYNTVRWIVQPGSGYAVGPSRANPFTGEIFHADIRICADFIRSMFGEMEKFVDPMTGDDLDRILSNHQAGLAYHAAFGWHILSARGELTPDSPQGKKYIRDAIVHLVAHEVGHTLGLRHNFKGSTLHPSDSLHDEELTTEKGLTGSIMDYVPVNLAAPGEKQGQYWQTTLGPYDYWAIEYAHKQIDAETPEDELPELNAIASKVADAELAYGTDEDAFSPPTGIDPTCNRWDLGDDPLDYYRRQIKLSKELWSKMEAHFEKPGERYRKLRSVFDFGFRQYRLAASTLPKFIGGIYHYRDHIGDPNGRIPFQPVPAEKQRETLRFMIDEFLSPEAFSFPPDLLNKLAPERLWDFQGSVWNTSRIDYPIHSVVASIQSDILNSLYQPLLLARMLDIEARSSETDRFTMAELFETLRNAIWSEVIEGANINSFRRELQRIHLSKLIESVTHPSDGMPQDAISLARLDLIALRKRIKRALKTADFDVYTQAHLDEVLSKIKTALKAVAQRNL